MSSVRLPKVILIGTRVVNEKIWSVSTRLSEHLIAIRHLNKLETASISICKQNKSNAINAMHIISSDDHIQ